MEYNEVDKYYILNGHLKLGLYIKAEPIDINKNATTFYGFLTSVNIINNLYSKTTITIKYDKKIGVNRTDPIDINKWHNVTATAIVHPMIINTDPDQLQEQVFQTIRKPLLISP